MFFYIIKMERKATLLQEVRTVKKITLFIGMALLITVMYYLYKYQLGSISFFILSFIFFSLAKKEFSNKPTKKFKKPSR